MRPGLDVEFYMRRYKNLFESLRIKQCGISFGRRILHALNRIRERGKHCDGHNKDDFFSRWQVCNEDRLAWLTKRTVSIWIKCWIYALNSAHVKCGVLIKCRTSVVSSTGLVKEGPEPVFNSFESLRIDLDVTFHMHRMLSTPVCFHYF